MGSQWETTVSLASTALEGVSMPVPLLEDPFDGCALTGEVIDPNGTYHICKGYASPSGLFLFIPKTLEPKDLFINAHVRDLSRSALSAGTQIPVARESDFRSGDLLLQDIPSDARFRANLRIYAATNINSSGSRFINQGGIGGSVQVDIFEPGYLGTWPPLVNTTVDMSAAQTIPGSPYLTIPGYFSFGDLVATFPQLATVPRYTIRIRTGQPLISPPVELTSWAFVTITNNETQEVTIVSP